MAKRLSSRYLPGKRMDALIKIKRSDSLQCAIIGFLPAGERDFKSLILAAVEEGHLRCVGKVGTGFNRPLRARLNELLWSRLRDRPLVPCKIRGRWVEPGLCCTVKFMERTPGGELREMILVLPRAELQVNLSDEWARLSPGRPPIADRLPRRQPSRRYQRHLRRRDPMPAVLQGIPGFAFQSAFMLSDTGLLSDARLSHGNPAVTEVVTFDVGLNVAPILDIIASLLGYSTGGNGKVTRFTPAAHLQCAVPAVAFEFGPPELHPESRNLRRVIRAFHNPDAV
jgi:hypothetical protein